MSINRIKKTTEFYLTVIFTSVFLCDFLIKISLINEFVTYYNRYNAFVKTILEIFFIVKLFKIGINKNLVVIVTTLVLCFVIGQLYLYEQSVFYKDLINEILRGDIYHLNKYIFIILSVFFIQNTIYKTQIANTFIKVLIYLLIFNAFFILIGFLFNLNFFKSFPDSPRFGYSGLFSKSGEAVLLYIMVTILFYIRYLSNKNIYPVLFFMIIAILTGKKIALSLPLLLFLDYALIRSKFKYYLKIILITSFLLAVFYIESIALCVIDIFPFWKPLYNEKGMWAVIFSTRNLSFFNAVDFVQNYWTLPNYLFGGVNYNSLKIEIDPFDLIMFFGFFGSVLYSYFINLFFFKKIIRHKILLIGFFCLAMLYGAFLFNTLLLPAFFLFLIHIKDFIQDKNKDDYNHVIF